MAWLIAVTHSLGQTSRTSSEGVSVGLAEKLAGVLRKFTGEPPSGVSAGLVGTACWSAAEAVGKMPPWSAGEPLLGG